MLCLIINTASQYHELLLTNDTKIISHASWRSERKEATILLPKIQELLNEQSKELQDLTHILVVTGPGGFTSIRVGVTIANTLAYSLDISAAGISLFDWWNHKLRGETDYLLLSSSTSDLVFAQGFGNAAERVPSFRLQVIQELDTGDAILRGELIEKHRDQLPQFEPSQLHEKTVDVAELFGSVEWKEEVVEPLYGREAVQK